MRVHILVVLALVSVTAHEWTTFREWQKTYGRAYNSSEEETRRYSIWGKNLKMYEENNRLEAANGPDTARYGPDEYSDLTMEEWKAAHGIRPFTSSASPDGQCNFEAQNYSMSPAEIAKILRENGESIDWREKGAVTAVKNQGSYGTCGYFATLSVMEGINVIQGKNPLIKLSEQENIDCCTSKEGCHGWPGEEIDWYKNHKWGASTEASYPYKGKTGTCKRDQATPTKAMSSGKMCVGNGAGGDQSAILAHLIQYGPAVWMMGSGGLSGYRSGVITNKRGSPGTFPDYRGIDHATTLVGAGESSNGTPYWIVKNSWGASFGEKGYYRVQRDGSPPELNCPGGMFGNY